MNNDYLDMMRTMDLEAPTSEESISQAERIMGVQFPEQYKSFMKLHNGAEGLLGENSYLVIWSIDEIAELNIDYGFTEYTPGLVVFGSDGGEMAYAFDMRDEKKKIVEIPMDSIHIEEAEFISDTFEGFIEALYKL